MKNFKLKNGQEISVEQLRNELGECKISQDSQTQFVRWNHETLGIVFDTLSDYRKYGNSEPIEKIDLLVPFYDC